MESILFWILIGVFSARAVATDVPVLLLNQPVVLLTTARIARSYKNYKFHKIVQPLSNFNKNCKMYKNLQLFAVTPKFHIFGVFVEFCTFGEICCFCCSCIDLLVRVTKFAKIFNFCYTARHKEINARSTKTTNFTKTRNLTKITKFAKLCDLIVTQLGTRRSIQE